MLPTGLVILLSGSAETASLVLLLKLELVRSCQDVPVLSVTEGADLFPDVSRFTQFPKMEAEWKNKYSRHPHGGLASLRSYMRANNPIRRSGRNGSRKRR